LDPLELKLSLLSTILSRPQPIKVIQVIKTNRQPVYDFLLLVNSNLGHIFYRFRDIGTITSEIAVLPTPDAAASA